jgi:hypothetical protein
VPSSELLVARDPALALVVRIFVGAVGERWDVPEPARDDLRLAASELFAGAVDAGAGDAVSFVLTLDGTAVSLEARGVAPREMADRGDPAVPGDRLDLIRALFPEAIVGDPVTIRVPAGA